MLKGGYLKQKITRIHVALLLSGLSMNVLAGIISIPVVGHREPSGESTYVPTYNYQNFINDGMSRSEGAGDVIANPSAQQNSKKDCKSTKPVIIMTGEKYKNEADFIGGGLYGISLNRTYRSQHATGTLFGPNWLSSLDQSRLTFVAPMQNWAGRTMYRQITLTQPDGTKYLYQVAVIDDGNGKTATYNVRSAAGTGELTWTDQVGYTLERDERTYVYDNAGYLRSTTDHVTGQVLTFEQAPAWGGTFKVSSNSGQSVEFTQRADGRVTQVRDSGGNIWTYDYNAAGMLAKVTSPGGTDIREYVYEETAQANAGQLLTGILINGQRYSRYSYYGDGRVKTSALEDGQEVDNFTYGTNQTTITDAFGQPTTYSYQTILGESKVTQVSRSGTSTCSAAAAQTVYDTNGYVDYEIDWNNNRTEYAYDGTGLLQEKTTAALTSSALTVRNTWLGSQISKAEYLDSNGSAYLQIEYTYSGSRLASETKTDLKTNDKRKVTYGYTNRANGTLDTETITVSIPGGSAITTLKYDSFGNLVSKTNALGQVESWSDYTGDGLPGKYTDLNGVVTTYGYYPNGALHTQTKNGLVTSWSYTHDGQTATVTYPSGKVSRFQYTASSHLSGVGNALGEYATITVDMGANSRRLSSTRMVPSLNGSTPVGAVDGEFSATTILDSLGRVYTETGNNGQTTNRTYDNNGNLKTVTNAANAKTSYDYDEQNRLTATTVPGGGVTRYRYDPQGNLWQVTDPRSLTTTYTDNGFGDVTSISSPDTGTTTYTYDEAGNMATKTASDGRVTYYSWDKLGRQTYYGSAPRGYTFTYDDGSFGIGNLARFNDWTGSTTFTYNANGQVTQQVNNIYGSVYATSWGYDAAGRLASMTYPDGVVVRYAYDSAGRVSALTSNLGGASATIANNILYQPATDLRYAWRFGNNVPRALTFDKDTRLQRLQSPSRHDLTVKYGSTNLIDGFDDNVYGGRSTIYRYDADDHLSVIGLGTGDWQTFDWTTSDTQIGFTRGNVAHYDFVPDANSNRLASWSGPGQGSNFQYDSLGNLTTETRPDGTGRTYAYEEFGRLSTVAVNGNQVADYRYNLLHQRVLKIANGTSTYYIYGPSGELISEIGARATNYVRLDGELMGITRASQLYASHNDQLGRPQVLTDPAGAVAWRAEDVGYDRRIVVDAIGGFNIGFPGQYFDSETGLWYNWHRYFDPERGRYMQSDPLGLAGGNNTYLYAAGNPVSFIDPYGLYCLSEKAINAWGGGISGAVSGGYALKGGGIYGIGYGMAAGGVIGGAIGYLSPSGTSQIAGGAITGFAGGLDTPISSIGGGAVGGLASYLLGKVGVSDSWSGALGGLAGGFYGGLASSGLEKAGQRGLTLGVQGFSNALLGATVQAAVIAALKAGNDCGCGK